MARIPLWLVGATAAVATTALAGGAMIIAKISDAPPSAAVPASAECDQNRRDIADLDKQIADLRKAELPADIARQTIGVIDELIAGLNEVNGDADQIVGPTLKAQKKLDELAKTIKAAGGEVPDGWPRLKSAIGGLGGDIQKGVKKFKASETGKGLSDVDALKAVIKPVVGQLDALRTTMEGVLATDKAANGSGAEQIEAMKFGFDRLRSTLPVDAVPGLGNLFKAYSDALGGMSKSVGTIEGATRAKLRMADEALKGTGVSVAGLYPGMQTPREQAKARLDALIEARNGLIGARNDLECDKPPPPRDPCKEGDMAAISDLIDRMTATAREEFDYRQKEYERLFRATAMHSLSQPKAESSSAERVAQGMIDRLDVLKRAAETRDYSPTFKTIEGVHGLLDAISYAQTLADELGVTIPPRGRVVDNQYLIKVIAALQPEVKRRGDKAFEEGKTEYGDALKAWSKAHAELLAAATDAGKQRDRARAALARRTAEVVDQETRAKEWDKARYDLFDECFPALGADRRRRSPPPPPTPAPSAPMPPGPAVQPPPTPQTPAVEPTPKGACANVGGLSGRIDGVACQIRKGG